MDQQREVEQPVGDRSLGDQQPMGVQAPAPVGVQAPEQEIEDLMGDLPVGDLVKNQKNLEAKKKLKSELEQNKKYMEIARVYHTGLGYESLFNDLGSTRDGEVQKKIFEAIINTPNKQPRKGKILLSTGS